MLVIKSYFFRTALDWDSVESISFDDKSEAPDCQLRIATKSGNLFTVTNPTDLMGEAVDFDISVKAWLDRYTCWTVKENNSKNAPNLPFN